MKVNPAQICMNGHIITENANVLENRSDICKEPKCKERTILECLECGAIIQGTRVSKESLSFSNKPPSHCHECKHPYPWEK